MTGCDTPKLIRVTIDGETEEGPFSLSCVIPAARLFYRNPFPRMRKRRRSALFWTENRRISLKPSRLLPVI